MVLVWVQDILVIRWSKESFRTTFPSTLTAASSVQLTALPKKEEVGAQGQEGPASDSTPVPFVLRRGSCLKPGLPLSASALPASATTTRESLSPQMD